MHITIRTTFLRVVCLLPLALVACSDGSDSAGTAGTLGSEEGILRYVPADTPYVVAMAEPMPDDVREKLGAQTETLMRSYTRLIQAVINEPPVDPEASQMDAETRARLSAMIEDLSGMITADGIPAAGIDRDSTAAFYGVGLLPVLRVTLTDGDLFATTFKQMEERAGKAMSVATIDGQPYRYAGDEGRLIIAVIGDQLVISVAPAELPEELLKSVLGLSLPASSVADSGLLADVAEKYGFQDYLVGVIDVQRIASTFLGDQDGVNGALLAMMDHDTSTLSDVCKAEIRSMAGIVPRFVTGYTAVTTEHLDSNSIFELRSDLATGLQALTAPVPGLGTERGGLVSFGMSVNLPAARDFYSARLDAMEADPYKCELFAEMQAGVAEGRAMLNQPVPPMVYGFRGFLAVIDDIKGLDFQNLQPPTDIDMRFLVATDNAEGLLAMGAMFSPELAALNLKPDSQPVKVEIPAVAAMTDAAYVAMSENALALSVGSGNGANLTDMLAATSAEPAPFMSMGMDAGRYYGFLGDAMAAGASADDDGEASPEVARATGELMKAFEKVFSRIHFDVQFTERGIEVPSSMALAE